MQIREILPVAWSLELVCIAASPGVHKHTPLCCLPFFPSLCLRKWISLCSKYMLQAFPFFCLGQILCSIWNALLSYFGGQISKYYWSLRPYAKSSFSGKPSLTCSVGNGCSTFSIFLVEYSLFLLVDMYFPKTKFPSVLYLYSQPVTCNSHIVTYWMNK